MMLEGAPQERKVTRQQQTLRSGQEFRRVYAEGRKISAPYFSAFLLKTEGTEQRLGITVTRKIGKAVIRNQCKRRLRELFRLRDRSRLSATGFDLVINVRPEMVTADFSQIKAAFENMLVRFESVARTTRNDSGNLMKQ